MLVLSPWLGVGTPVRNPSPSSSAAANNYLALPNTYGAPSSLASNYHMPSILVSYEFVKNWTRFLAALDDAGIEDAVNSLREMLEVDSLVGRSFIDVGSGSGLCAANSAAR